MPPKVSIGMPVYNAENYIEQAIQSILSQTFTDLELIISDNASSDRTQAICERHATEDKRVRYHRNSENIGANRNFNHVFTLARGEYFKWAAHDDVIAPDYLEKCLLLLENDSTFVLAHSETKLIDPEGNEITVPEGANYVKDERGRIIFIGLDSTKRPLDSSHAHKRFQGVLDTGWCNEVFGVIRSHALRDTPLLRPFYGADKVLLAELASMGRFAIIPEPLFHNRRHPEQSRSQSVEDRAAWTQTAARKSSGLKRNVQKAIAYMEVPFKGSMSFSERMQCLSLALRYNTVKLGYEFGIVKEKDMLR